MTSLASLGANFNINSNYSAVIASGVSVANFNFNTNIVLNMAGFTTGYSGLFQLAVQGTNLVLNYTGSDAYTWTDVSTNFSANSGWVNDVVPSVNRSNLVVSFGGATAIGYTAHNDLTNLVTKSMILTNNRSGTVQIIDGNPFTFAGIAPELDQNGSSAFVISNNITLGYTLSAGGSGAGTVTLAGNLAGNTTSLIKTGTWTLVLGGSNTYNGATVVQDGHLFIANSYGLSGSTLSNVAGAAVITHPMVFTGNFNKAYLGGLAGSLDLGLTNTAGGIDLVVDGNNHDTTYNGALSGSGSLTKAGTGTLILGGINTYSGDTIINTGTLVAGSLANGIGGTGSSLGTGTQIIIAGGTLRFGSGGALLVVTNPVAGIVSLNSGTLDAGSVANFGLIANNSGPTTVNSDFANMGSGSLAVLNGTLVITGVLFNASTVLINNSATLKVGTTGLGWMTNAGSVVLGTGTMNTGTINNSGTISGRGTLAGAVANSGLVSANVSNGLLTIAGLATGPGEFRADAGATLSFNGGGQISRLFNMNATIRVGGGSLTNISAFSNDGTLALAGGTYQASVAFTNNNWLVGYGTFSSPAQLVNQGTIAANLHSTNTPLVLRSDLLNIGGGVVRADASALQVSGVFTNNGTLQFISSVGTYSRDVVNDGVWNTQNSSSTFSNNFIITTNGYVAIATSDSSKYVFNADLFNQSMNNLHWNTLGVAPGSNTVGTGTEFLFSGSDVTNKQTFYTPGLLLAGGFDGSPADATTGVQNVTTMSAVTGFQNNFAVGQLWLTNTTLVLAQTPGITLEGAMFVNDLDLFGGSHLTINSNMTVYFVNSNGWSLADITLLGTAQIHQLNGLSSLLVIPEPNVLLMWLCGGITVWAARRRRTRTRRGDRH